LLIVSILAGCASGPTITPPEWPVIEDRQPVTDAKPLPILCPIPWQADDVQCWAALDAFDIVAEGNHDIAQANANALRNQEGATDAFIQAGQFQQQLTTFYADQLADERKAHWLDNALYKTIIGLALIGAAL